MMRYGSTVRACRIVCGAVVGLLLLSAAATGIGDVLIGWANPPVGRFIETSAGRQQILDVGPDNGTASSTPAVVLLHGLDANLGDMRLSLVPRLRARYRVIAVDRPGNGWSERADGAGDASPRRQAAILHEILGKLGVHRPLLLGHSWGGTVAATYALAYPNDLSGLVLLAPATHPWPTGVPWYTTLANIPWLGPLFVHTVALPVGYLILNNVVDVVFAPQHPPPDYVGRASILLALRPSAITANSQDLGGLEAFVTAQAPRYPQIRTPTVIITGTADHVVTPRIHARALAKQVPQARLIVLRGVGHMVHYAAPDRVVAAIDMLAAAEQPRTAVPEVKPQP
jgi:pimeloyl-ACP methyl ester carboxylesterase